MDPLKIELKESTQRKLGAIAVLTGRSYKQILDDASNIVDGLISDELVRCATNATGRSASVIGVAPQTEPSPLHQQTRTYEGERERESERVETTKPVDANEETLFGEFAHSLSSDEDDGEDKSPAITENLEVIPQEEVAPIRKAAKKKGGVSTLDDALRVEEKEEIVDVGEDAEAFLDAVIDPPKQRVVPTGTYSAGYAGVGRHSSAPRQAGTFNNKPRVTIREHTGNEENE